jgi:hypothetical protein
MMRDLVSFGLQFDEHLSQFASSGFFLRLESCSSFWVSSSCLLVVNKEEQWDKTIFLFML